MSDDDKKISDMDEQSDGTLLEYEKRLDEEDRQRREAEADMDMDIFDGVRSTDGNPVQPVKITSKDSFCFSCHKGVSCWNVCCHGADITLTPFDILRLSKHLTIKPAEFLKLFTVPAMWHGADMPVAKLRMDGKDGKGQCVFMDKEEGCTVYEDRPVNCRYYPLGLAAVKMKGSDGPEDFYFLVKEDHCKGHDENKELSVADFRKEQGVDAYDEQNRGWIEILMKMASWKVMGGPNGTVVPDQTKQMFFMATTDVDTFRKFVFNSKFLKTYLIDPELVEKLRTDDELLLKLGFDWMKNILFNDETIKMRQEVLNDSIARAREENPRGDG
jgi:Fe-S-cluster containining protein